MEGVVEKEIRFFDYFPFESFIGFDDRGYTGTWKGRETYKVISYVGMIALIEKNQSVQPVPVDKETTKELMKELQARRNTHLDDISKLEADIKAYQAVLDAPEPRFGRVMSVYGLYVGIKCFSPSCTGAVSRVKCDGDSWDCAAIEMGYLFYDKDSCDQYMEYLILEQELRSAQIADGGVPLIKGNTRYGITIDSQGLVKYVDVLGRFNKVTFNSLTARANFFLSHSSEQLKLLIRGV
jgi:hypothetical protein